jgi:hypothetical protein
VEDGDGETLTPVTVDAALTATTMVAAASAAAADAKNELRFSREERMDWLLSLPDQGVVYGGCELAWT